MIISTGNYLKIHIDWLRQVRTTFVTRTFFQMDSEVGKTMKLKINEEISWGNDLHIIQSLVRQGLEVGGTVAQKNKMMQILQKLSLEVARTVLPSSLSSHASNFRVVSLHAVSHHQIFIYLCTCCPWISYFKFFYCYYRFRSLDTVNPG